MHHICQKYLKMKKSGALRSTGSNVSVKAQLV